jgi:hypothetical protein
MFSVAVEFSQLSVVTVNTFIIYRSGQKHFTVIANLDV